MAATVVIDCEAAYYLATESAVVHRQLHTFVGAALAGVATSLLLLGARRVLRRARAWFEARSIAMRSEGSSIGLVVGAMTGALTHPLFDGVMHRDIEPFQPWTAANPLQGAIGLGALHLGCLFAGIAGGVLLAVRR